MVAEKHRFKNTSKTRPCPICGKPDWCGFMQIEEGELVVCQRDGQCGDMAGYDGNFYVFISRPAGKSSSIYEEANQRMRRVGDKASSCRVLHAQEEQRQYTVVDPVEARENEYLDQVYRFLLSRLVLDDGHRSYLSREGWGGKLMERHLVRSFPEKDHLRYRYGNNPSTNPYRKKLADEVLGRFKGEFGPDCLRGVPGAYRDAKGDWTFSGAKGILFPQYDAKGMLYRLRIRRDFLDVPGKLVNDGSGDPYYQDGKRKVHVSMSGTYEVSADGGRMYDKSGGKYRNFSSYYLHEGEYSKGFIVNAYQDGCESGNNLGLYMNLERDNMYVCYLTEGEKKGIFSNDRLRAPVVDVPGVNSFHKLVEGRKGCRMIDVLRARGIGMFVIAYDADKAVNKAVLSAESGTIEALRKEGFAVGLADWPMTLGKGLDDLLANGHMPTYSMA